MSDHAAETIAAAARIEHEWDRRALDWPLTSYSVVVEVGGYKGRWALQIAERYRPRLYVFEPQRWAAEVCREVLGNRAFIMDLALGADSGRQLMGEWETDGCSLVKDGAEHQVELWEIGRVFRYLKIDRIDLMLMNIEGYEYRLIPHMIDQGIIPERLMVQMHSFAGDSGALRGVLAEHYQLLWDYGDVLSAWGRT